MRRPDVHRKLQALVLAATAMLLLTEVVDAQIVRGLVMDSLGRPISDAAVSLLTQKGTVVARARSSTNGTYTISSDPYDLVQRASVLGFMVDNNPSHHCIYSTRAMIHSCIPVIIDGVLVADPLSLPTILAPHVVDFMMVLSAAEVVCNTDRSATTERC